MTSRRDSARTHEYELGHSDRELKRLATQAQLVDPFTREFFRNGGVAPGMRVLDVGSGAGDTALLAADIVEGAGEVVGIDRSALAVSAAHNRIKAPERRNISFREGTPEEALDPAETFDAAVGRYVLMFSPTRWRCSSPLRAMCAPVGSSCFTNPTGAGVVRPLHRRRMISAAIGLSELSRRLGPIPSSAQTCFRRSCRPAFRRRPWRYAPSSEEPRAALAART